MATNRQIIRYNPNPWRRRGATLALKTLRALLLLRLVGPERVIDRWVPAIAEWVSCNPRIKIVPMEDK